MRKLLTVIALAFATPGIAQAADRVVTLAPGNPFADAIRLGTPTGGPSVHDAVPSDVGDLVFTEKYDSEPVNGWFNRTYRAAMKVNGFLAKKPEDARYELTAEVTAMKITPLATGAYHTSAVTYHLREVATGKEVWTQSQSPFFNVDRGVRFGKIGRAMGAAAGGALTGTNPAVTAASIRENKIRPIDIRIDVYEGIMRGFQRMAEKTAIELATFQPPTS
jgi:hypothetical protein